MEKVKTTCILELAAVMVKNQRWKVVDTKPVMPPNSAWKGQVCIKGWHVHELLITRIA